MYLLTDVGGTNIRFAMCERGGAPTGFSEIAWEAHGSFISALNLYLEEEPLAHQVDGVALAIAGPAQDDSVALTNRKDVLRRSDISARFGGVPVNLLNDLEAQALALPHLLPTDVEVLRAGESIPTATKLAVNVGTGFGGAAVTRVGNDWHAVAGEPGYISLSPRNEDEAIFLSDCVVVEDYISGRGLAERSAQHPGHPMLSLESVPFGWHLGRATGDLSAATGAWGGVYLVGGVAQAWNARGPSFEALQAAFNNRGLMSERMKRIAIHRITYENSVFLGLASSLERSLERKNCI